MKVLSYGGVYEVVAKRATYANNRNLAVVLEDENGGPFATLTVNLNEKLPEGCAYVDTNNCPFAEKLILGNKLGEPTGRVGLSGYCCYPEYKFDLSKIEEMK